MIRPVVAANGTVVLMYDECNAVWLQPSDVRLGHILYPSLLNWKVAPGVSLEPGATRWADARDVEILHWEVEWQT